MLVSVSASASVSAGATPYCRGNRIHGLAGARGAQCFHRIGDATDASVRAKPEYSISGKDDLVNLRALAYSIGLSILVFLSQIWVECSAVVGQTSKRRAGELESCEELLVVLTTGSR